MASFSPARRPTFCRWLSDISCSEPTSFDGLAEAKKITVRVGDDELPLAFVVVADAVPLLFQIQNERAAGVAQAGIERRYVPHLDLEVDAAAIRVLKWRRMPTAPWAECFFHHQFDAIALDIGVSSMQLDQADRGFAFSADGPLDMRMSRSGLTAAEFLNEADEAEFARVLRDYVE